MIEASKFLKLLNELEQCLNNGVFLSFIGKILIDEKKIYSIINELRGLVIVKEHTSFNQDNFDNLANIVNSKLTLKHSENLETANSENKTEVLETIFKKAEEIKQGANKYADEKLSELENILERMLDNVKKGREILTERLG